MDAFTSILVEIDALAVAQPALEGGAALARECGANVRLVDATMSPQMRLLRPAEDNITDVIARRRESLARLAADHADVVTDSDVLTGLTVDALIADVERIGHDLLVRAHARDIVAPRGSGFGVVDMDLFRRCPCTVWAMGFGAKTRHPHVVAAVDLAADDAVKQRLNRNVVETASDFARLQQGSLTVFHAWQPVAARQVAGYLPESYAKHVEDSQRRRTADMEEYAHSFGKRLDGCRRELQQGDVERVLPEFVVTEGVDLIVLGTMARAGLNARLRPNTAESLLQRLPCSTVVVKPSARNTISARGATR